MRSSALTGFLLTCGALATAAPAPAVELEHLAFNTAPASSSRDTVMDAALDVVHMPPVVKASGCPLPRYPWDAESFGEAGRVVVAVRIDQKGRVVGSKVQDSSGYMSLDEATHRAVRLCKFIPGSADGKPEPTWGRIAYEWRIVEEPPGPFEPPLRYARRRGTR